MTNGYIPRDGDIKFPEDSGVTCLKDAQSYSGEFFVYSSHLGQWVSNKEKLVWEIEVE